MAKKFHIVRNYVAQDVYEIDAGDADEAMQKYLAGENHEFVRTIDDAPYDDEIIVEAV